MRSATASPPSPGNAAANASAAPCAATKSWSLATRRWTSVAPAPSRPKPGRGHRLVHRGGVVAARTGLGRGGFVKNRRAGSDGRKLISANAACPCRTCRTSRDCRCKRPLPTSPQPRSKRRPTTFSSIALRRIWDKRSPASDWNEQGVRCPPRTFHNETHRSACLEQ